MLLIAVKYHLGVNAGGDYELAVQAEYSLRMADLPDPIKDRGHVDFTRFVLIWDEG